MELAKAYVQIIPTTDNIKNNLTTALGGDAASEAGAQTGDTWGYAFASAFKNPIIQVAKAAFDVAALGITTATAAFTGLMVKSISEYGEYEQLVGGAELMFGDAYDYIAEKASTAYKDVQISQNEYLTQVNGFAVGLKTAMEGNEQAAAELADRIVKAEADVVAATGKDRESVENAFNGIMRNNFTMLDNLGLGINATKEGMQQVIDEVNAWNAANGNITEYTMENIADMEAALVDYVEMQGMANYASMEGATTIQGSFASLKAAFSDLMVGLSSEGANIPQLTGQLVTQAIGTFENIIPLALQFTEGFSEAILEASKGLASRIPDFIEGLNEFLPKLFETWTETMKNLAETTPYIIELAMTVLGLLAEAIYAYALDYIPNSSVAIIDAFKEGFDKQGEQIIALGKLLLENLGQGVIDNLGSILEVIEEIFEPMLNTIEENMPIIIEGGTMLASNLAAGISEHFAEWISSGGIQDLLEGFATVWNAFDWGALGTSVVDLIISSISSGAGRIWDSIKSAILGDGTSAASKVISTANTTKNVVTKASEVSVNITGNLKKFLNASTTTSQKKNAAYGHA